MHVSFSSLSAFLLLFLASITGCTPTEETPPPSTDPPLPIIAYYAGSPDGILRYNMDQLDQVIHSFLHLQGNKLALDDAADSLGLVRLAKLKEEHPHLKVLLSLGGWGGCKTCSDVFSTDVGRKEFARSVLDLLQQFRIDGIDLDWEYPGIAGYPGHAYKPEDTPNFTRLVQELRTVLGEDYEISFAAGGFKSFFDNSAEWDKVMPLVDRVNLMTYDLVSGFSKRTGHHTALFSTDQQIRSADQAIRYLDSLGVPKEKMVIGAAFYARIWEGVPNLNNGLYQSGSFKQSVRYHQLDKFFSEHPGFQFFRDPIAQAPYAYHPDSMWFATYDDSLSVVAKTRYVREQGLGGIMFWQLAGDKPQGGLLKAMYTEKKK